METLKIKSWSGVVLNGFCLFTLNLSLIMLIGYLTLDSGANLNSRIGGLVASLFIPYFIATKTRQMGGLERMLKFGAGFIFYIISCLLMVGITVAFQTWLLPCLIFNMAVLYCGKRLV